MKPSDFKIGQVICFIPGDSYGRHRGKPQEFAVHSIGRKWVTAGNRESPSEERRFDPATMKEEYRGHGISGHFVLSLEVHLKEVEREIAWSALKRMMSFRAVPQHMTTQQINEFSRLIEGKDKTQ